MTRESWHSGTYSHEWGTSAIVGVVWGIMGVHQTSPAWGSWTMKPKLGGLTTATITVPTITGSSLGPWLHHGSPPPFGAC